MKIISIKRPLLVNRLLTRSIILASTMFLVACGGGAGLLPSDLPPVVSDPIGPTNLAFGQVSAQSSTGFGGDAERAIDGNSSGIYRDQSITHTVAENQPWWQVDLGQVSNIESIEVFNRVDSTLGDRLSDFVVFITQDDPTGRSFEDLLNDADVWNYSHTGVPSETTMITVGNVGRFVRVQLPGSDNPLALAEVVVMGTVIDGATSDPIVSPDPVVSYELGAEIYAENCAACHLPLELSNKRNITLEQLITSISEVPVMRNLQLTDVELESVVFALNSDAPITDDPVTSPVTVLDTTDLYSVLVRLTNDEFLATLGYMLDFNNVNQEALEQVALAEETPDAGLVSSAERQQLSQIALGRFLFAAEQAIDIQLNNAQNNQANLDNAASRIPGCDDFNIDCIRVKGVEYIERGYRGHASSEDIDALDNLLDELEVLTHDDDYTLLLRKYVAVVQFISLSPKFSTHYEIGIASQDSGTERQLTSTEISNKLAYFITGSPPDEELEQSAADNLLTASAERRTQTARLVSNEESITGVENIVANWLKLDVELTTDSAIQETRDFLNAWIADKRSFSDLYSAMVAVENEAGGNTEEPFGILGLEGVLASNTNDTVPTFINRGEFVTAELLCAQLPTDLPDEALNNDDGAVDTPLEVFEIHDKDACATCHVVFDNYGAALYGFNTTADLFNNENELGGGFDLFPIGDVSGTVSNPAELSEVLGASHQAHSCFVELWYRHATRRDLIEGVSNIDHQVIDGIVEEWMSGDTSVQSLLEIITGHETFDKLYR